MATLVEVAVEEITPPTFRAWLALATTELVDLAEPMAPVTSDWKSTSLVL